MKQKRQVFEPYGLRARFALSLVLSILLCGFLFFILHNAADYYLTNYFERSVFMESHVQRQGESLQKYIRENDISSKNLEKLKKWEYRQPLILLELYSNGNCLYSSFYDIPDQEFRYDETIGDEDHIISVQLTDMKVQAVLYSDFTYKYYVLATAFSAALTLVLFVLLFLRSNQKMIRYICRLNEEVQILEGGNLEYQVSVEGNDEITDLARSMNRMKESFQQQMETEQNLHQANRRLVTEMSHDLRTPLTGMMLYLEILRSHRYTTEEELQDYLDKINAKAHHIKQLSDHLFEYSLTEMPKETTEPQQMRDAFLDVTDHFIDDLSAHGFSVVSELSWISCYVEVSEEFLRRIFENIASNIIKYADPAAEILISTIETAKSCGFSVMNTCAVSSCQMESNGVGIESIRTMMRRMNGSCMVEQTETAFEITLLFPKFPTSTSSSVSSSSVSSSASSE